MGPRREGAWGGVNGQRSLRSQSKKCIQWAGCAAGRRLEHVAVEVNVSDA